MFCVSAAGIAPWPRSRHTLIQSRAALRGLHRGAALSEALAAPRAAAAVSSVPRSAHPLKPLHDPATTRLRCAGVLRAVEQNLSPGFKLNRAALPALADRVAALTLRCHPTLEMPLHSCWRHFEAGGVDRKAELDRHLSGRSAVEVARAQFDLAVVCALLDAQTGAGWRYTESTALSAAALPHAAAEDLLALLDAAASARPVPSVATPAPATGDTPAPSYAHSEGLAVAVFRAFMAGAFSATPGDPCRADAAVLRHLDVTALRAVLQSSPSNPLVGLEGRAAVLASLGVVLQQEAASDAATGLPAQARPGLLFDRLAARGRRTAPRPTQPEPGAQALGADELQATDVLGEVLQTLSPIWPGGSKVQGLAAADVWRHNWAGAKVGGGGLDRTTEGWVPLHKPALWLTGSLLEPLRWAGIAVGGVDALTAMPEHANGGLLIDGGVLVPRDPRLLQRDWKLHDEFVIEWRALTVALLDELAVLVRLRLNKTAQELPLAVRLQASTRAAGREIARELRQDGAPPLRIESDGTVL